MKKKYNTKKDVFEKSGFTLIEVLVSLAMVAILTGTTLQVVRFSDTKKSLAIEANRFRSAIREAQTYALAIPNEKGEHICGFGVYVNGDATSYQLFYTAAAAENWDIPSGACNGCRKHDELDPANCIIDSIGPLKISLPDGMSFNSSNIGKDIFFKVPYGEVYQENDPLSGSYVFGITHGANSEEVSINDTGKVE